MSASHPLFVTFTGADDHTDVAAMAALQREIPSVEWGILFSPKQQGNGRYPTLGFIKSLDDRGLNLAAHICGGHARDILASGRCAVVEELPYGMFRRIQVNTPDPGVDPGAVADFARRVGSERAILQARAAFPDDTRVDWLYDRSGGTGATPESWPEATGRHPLFGYAGGLGPDNVAQALEAIRAANPEGRPYWIDMETKVRSDDRFDLGKCRQVLERAYRA